MNTQAQSIQSWRAVRSRIGHTSDIMTIPKTMFFPHPRDAGARLTTTWPVGQLADYVLEFEIGAAPLLIREFADRYEAFLSGVQLAQRVIKLVESNPTAALYVGSALLGASIGTAIVRKSEGALIGAGVGLLIAGILQAVNANGRNGYSSAD
jgi:hypothetical protein